jgi:hypothetical protein
MFIVTDSMMINADHVVRFYVDPQEEKHYTMMAEVAGRGTDLILARYISFKELSEAVKGLTKAVVEGGPVYIMPDDSVEE